jgi:hypothetical protein
MNRQYEEAFVNGLTEFRGAKVVKYHYQRWNCSSRMVDGFYTQGLRSAQLYTTQRAALEKRKNCRREILLQQLS